MEKTAVTELNALLKGEQMAVHAYERFIQDVENDDIRQEFQRFQKDHERHSGELSKRIRELGGKPDGGTGIAGVMAGAKAVIERVGNRGLVDILKEAYDGEDKGIAMVEEIIKGDLDKESHDMVMKMVAEDHAHLRQMAKIIGKFEEEEQ